MMLFNTETRQKEEVPSHAGVVKLYTCGPTVYNFAHIGNFRTYVFEDILRRALELEGKRVEQVMNLTDIDDKTIRGALQEGIPLKEFTRRYSDAFFADLDRLSIQRAHHYPAATDYIPQMIEMIEKLLAEGIAYVGADKSVYFAIKKFPSYGRLSHLKLDELETGASGRVESDEYDKDHCSDFVLWKSYEEERDGPIFWESPFGRGRPGWHIECSAMATTLLGETVDIHAGGVDNIFPHHENEIAQSECCSHKQFVRHWVHSEHLLVDGRKMSKSLGNCYTLPDLLEKGYSVRSIRYLLLQGHYRMPLNFTFEGLQAAASSLERIAALVVRLRSAKGKESDAPRRAARLALESFKEALSDDLNISVALASLFELVRETNALLDRDEVSPSAALEVLTTLKEMDKVLAVLPLEQEEEKFPEELVALLQRREEARRAKRWQEADQCRNELQAKGFVIEDTPAGPRLKRRSA